MLARPVRLFPTLFSTVVCAHAWICLLIRERSSGRKKEIQLLHTATCLLSNPKPQNEQKTCPTNLEQPWQTEGTYFLRHCRTQTKPYMTILWLWWALIWASMKPSRLPQRNEKTGWNSSPSSSGTQPFDPQTLTWTPARKWLLWTLGGDFWKADPLFLQNASSITPRFSRERASSSSNCAHWTCRAFQWLNRNICPAT